MACTAFDGLVWLVVCLVVFILVKRALDFEIQAIFLLIFRKPNFAIGLYSILFLPGVLLHELSHYLTAVARRKNRSVFHPTSSVGKWQASAWLCNNSTNRCHPGYNDWGCSPSGRNSDHLDQPGPFGVVSIGNTLFHARWDGVGLAFDGLNFPTGFLGVVLPNVCHQQHHASF